MPKKVVKAKRHTSGHAMAVSVEALSSGTKGRSPPDMVLVFPESYADDDGDDDNPQIDKTKIREEIIKGLLCNSMCELQLTQLHSTDSSGQGVVYVKISTDSSKLPIVAEDLGLRFKVKGAFFKTKVFMDRWKSVFGSKLDVHHKGQSLRGMSRHLTMNAGGGGARMHTLPPGGPGGGTELDHVTPNGLGTMTRIPDVRLLRDTLLKWADEKKEFFGNDPAGLASSYSSKFLSSCWPEMPWFMDILLDDNMVDEVMEGALSEGAGSHRHHGGHSGGGHGHDDTSTVDKGRLRFTFLKAYHQNAKATGKTDEPEFEMERIERQWKAECIKLIEDLSKSDLLGRCLGEDGSTLTKQCIGGYQKYTVDSHDTFVRAHYSQKGYAMPPQNASFLYSLQRQQILAYVVSETLRTELKLNDDPDCHGLEYSEFMDGFPTTHRLMEMGVITDYFALHEYNSPLYLRIDKVSWNFFRWSMDDIRCYFGEEIAFYFAWLSFYNKALYIPAIGGAIVFTLDWLYPAATWAKLAVAVYCAVVALWCVLFTETWKRRQVELACRWGVTEFEEEEKARPEYVRPMVLNMTAGQGPQAHHNWAEEDDDRACSCLPNSWDEEGWRLTKQNYVSKPTVYVLIVCVIIVAITILGLRPVLEAVSHSINEERGDPKGVDWGGPACSVLNAVTIQVMNYLYGTVALKLNDWENYRTQTDYDDNLIAKTFIFRFVNSYILLFYIAFFKRFHTNPLKWVGLDVVQFGNQTNQARGPTCIINPETDEEDCLYELSQQLAGIFVSLLIMGQIQQNVLPWLQTRLCSGKSTSKKTAADKAGQKHSCCARLLSCVCPCCCKISRQTRFRNGRWESGSPVDADAFRRKWEDALGEPLTNGASSRGVSGNSFDSNAYSTFSDGDEDVEMSGVGGDEGDDEETDIVEKQMLLASSAGSVDDFMAMVIQIGYVTLFAAAFPLAPLCACLSNVIEMATDMNKFLTYTKRPFYAGAEDIGAWQDILVILGKICVLTNICLICFTSSGANSLFQDSPDGTVLTTNRLLAVIIAEHVLLAVITLFEFLIPDVPKSVSEAIERDMVIHQEAEDTVDSKLWAQRDHDAKLKRDGLQAGAQSEGYSNVFEAIPFDEFTVGSEASGSHRSDVGQ